MTTTATLITLLLLSAPTEATPPPPRRPDAKPAPRRVSPAPPTREAPRARKVASPEWPVIEKRPAPSRPKMLPRPAPHPRAPVKVVRKKPIPHTWPSSLGPYELATKDGRSSLALGFAGQLQLEILSKDGADRQTEETPKLRRIRLLLYGSVLFTRLRYYLQLSTAPKSLEIMDFFLQYRVHRHVQVRIGQYKIPFSNHREGSFKSLTFVDWSIMTPAFGSERQLGIHVHNEGSAKAGVFYAFGLFTGQNARKAHANWLAATWGESLTNPSDLVHPAPLEGFHPELVARVAYKTGGINIKQDTDFTGGPFRFAATLGLAWDIAPTPYIDQPLRGVAELLMKARHWSGYASMYLSTARDGGQLSQRLAMLGGLVQTSYLFARRYEVAARYAIVHFDQSLLNDARLRAADLIEAEPDPDARAALASQYAGAGVIQREHEATVGFNWYFIKNNFKLQADLSWLGHERASGLLHDVRGRVQLQLAF